MIKADIEKHLELKHIRIVGNLQNNIQNVSVCVGAYLPEDIISEINDPAVDMVITGEITEYSVCEYIRDVSDAGYNKSLFILGHMGSEKSGMEYVCEHLADAVENVEFKYINCGEVY